MIALVGDVFSDVLLAGFVVVAVLFVVRVVVRVRLHHPLANRRFMRRYRAEHPVSGRPTVETSPTLAHPVAQPDRPADASGPGARVCRVPAGRRNGPVT